MGSALSSIAGGAPKRRAPPQVPSDEVLPCHPFDDTQTLRDYTLVWTFRFDDVLDADLLGSSLSQLFQMEGWRRLGGRLRLRPDGKIEVHVPREFTPERPSLHFTKEHFDVSIEEHPEASKLPKATDKPTTFPSPRNYTSLSIGPGAPRHIDDYLYSDLPQFALHVVTFTDSTLVSVVFNHITSDLGGLAAVLKGWQCILAGKPETVPPFMGFKEDAMAGLYKAPNTTRPAIADSQLVGWRLIVWALRQMLDAWLSPFESRLLCIPAKVADAVIKEARAEIESTPDAPEKPFISENDVVVALVNRLLGQHLSPTRNIVTLMAVNPRTRVKSVFRQDAAYVQNTPSAAFVSCSAGEALEMPLGQLALRSRRAIASQCTEESLKALATYSYDSLIKTANPPLFGDVGAALLVISNWSKAALLDTVDFSPAIVKASEKGAGTRPGRPVYYHSQSVEKGTFATTIAVIMGRDGNGNLWIQGDFPTQSWANLLEFLNERM